MVPHAFPDPEQDIPAGDGTPQTVVLGGGCFWCTEAVFLSVDGVLGVRSGYAGGPAETADYQSVCSGTTGHAEVIEVRVDPTRLTFGQVLKLFFAVAHDPTQRNRQGHDVGTQYRSAIFWADERQRDVAAAYIAQLDAAQVFPAPIATTLERLETFYEAEAYHQDYVRRNPLQPYVRAVAVPKVRALEEHFPDRLRADRR